MVRTMASLAILRSFSSLRRRIRLMRTRALGTLFVTALAATVWAGQQPPPRDLAASAATGAGVVAGRVVVADVSPVAPIRRARVSLSGGPLRAPEITDTDIEGNYRFTGLLPGAYRVTASKPGFVTLEAGAMHYTQRAAEIDVKNADSVRADIALPRGAAIEGRIVDSNAEPVQNLLIAASRFSHSALGRRTAAVKQTRTDDRGQYRIHSLPPGEYILEAAPDPRIEATEAVMPDRPPGRGRTYFPGTPQLHQARRLALAVGQELRGTNFTIEAVPLARVSGRVVDSSGAPVKAFGFRMVPAGGGASVSGSISPDGRFLLGHVPPGDYLMLASVLTEASAVGQYGAHRLAVSGPDLTDVTVVTAPGALLEGQVLVTGQAALPDLRRTRFEAIETEFELPPSRPPAAPITVQPDGRFAVRGLFGPRILRLSGLPPGWALESVRLADADITDVSTDFRESNAPRQLLMTITDQTGSVTGSVRTRAGQARAYEVIAIPEDEKLVSATSRFIHRGAPRADGTFNLSGLLPGRYRIAAVDFLDEGSWKDPDVLRKLAAAGTAVAVGSSSGQPLTLPGHDRRGIGDTRASRSGPGVDADIPGRTGADGPNIGSGGRLGRCGRLPRHADNEYE